MCSLEQELQQTKEQCWLSLLQSRDSSEADVLTIKSYYEQERLLREKKAEDERGRAETGFRRRLEELEQRHGEELQEIEERHQEQVEGFGLQSEQMEAVIRGMES